MEHTDYDISRMPGERCSAPCALCDMLAPKKGKRHWTVDRRTARRESRNAKYWAGAPMRGEVSE